ncbi:MAG: ABC transporter substrate-binding protein [Betaproteobacteria bacterium]|nr:MAG: ABC transporter substrate-binding protein [Betaproteobacteria bacterium]
MNRLLQRTNKCVWMFGAGLVLAAGTVFAAEQFVPLLSYRVGAYAAGGSGIFGGYIDYMNYINMKDGGINGVKLVWAECETEYNNSRGVECYERLKKQGSNGASLVQPLSTGITYSLIDRVAADKIPMITIGYGRTDAADGSVFPWVFPMITTYWSQASAMVKYIAQKEGGEANLKGKKIVHLYHDSAYGKEPIPVFEAYAKKLGFELTLIPVPLPGNDQQSQWLQIRQIKPDWVIQWGWGVQNPTAIKSAAKVGYPRNKMLGVWWAGSEEDVIPAGEAAKGYTAAVFNVSGDKLPLVQDIKKVVYAKGQGNMEDKSRVGSVYWVRGVVHGIITVEAIRTAQEHFGKGKVMSSDQIRWGIEHLDLSEGKLKALNALGMMPPLKMTCADHEGSGLVKFQTWDGSEWKIVSDWIAPDKAMIRQMIEESAAKYAKEKNITPRDCGKEG